MSESSNPAPVRTAVAMGSLYRELAEEGIPTDLAYEIVRDTARVLADRQPLVFKAEVNA